MENCVCVFSCVFVCMNIHYEMRAKNCENYRPIAAYNVISCVCFLNRNDLFVCGQNVEEPLRVLSISKYLCYDRY